jgi:methanogenic corrinoid protein MtbC1
MNVGAAAQVISLLQNSSHARKTRVMVGGYPFNLVPGLWRQIHADAYAPDALAALEVARHFLPENGAIRYDSAAALQPG